MEGDIRKNINKFRDLNFDLEQWTKDIVKSGVNKPMIISETSLNRIEKWINEKQIAGISAFREKLENVTPKTYLDFEKGHIYTKKQNIKRNMLLKSALLKLGYGATLVPGMSIERDRKVKEQSFVVVNLEDDPNFKENLLALGEAFNQDTVLFKDKNDDDAYLVGTNAVGYGIETPIGPFHENVPADFMSFIKNKGVAFGKKEDMTPPTRTNFEIRKSERSFPPKEEDVLNEIYSILELQVYDKLRAATRLLISEHAKPILEFLNKIK